MPAQTTARRPPRSSAATRPAGRPVLRGDRPGPAVAQALLQSQAGQGQPARVVVDGPPPGVAQEDADRRRLAQHAEALLRDRSPPRLSSREQERRRRVPQRPARPRPAAAAAGAPAHRAAQARADSGWPASLGLARAAQRREAPVAGDDAAGRVHLGRGRGDGVQQRATARLQHRPPSQMLDLGRAVRRPCPVWVGLIMQVGAQVRERRRRRDGDETLPVKFGSFSASTASALSTRKSPTPPFSFFSK